MTDKNALGGGNPNSLYNPMSETEQEVIQRLIEQEDLVVEIVNWGFFEKPKIAFGDLRISIPLSLTLTAPELHIPVFYFDLILKRRNGDILFQKRESTIQNNRPIYIGAGSQINMIWDIAIEKIKPHLVKKIKPGARGLTSRVGNMKMDEELKNLYNSMREGERKVREKAKQDAQIATVREKQETKPVEEKIIVYK